MSTTGLRLSCKIWNIYPSLFEPRKECPITSKSYNGPNCLINGCIGVIIVASKLEIANLSIVIFPFIITSLFGVIKIPVLEPTPIRKLLFELALRITSSRMLSRK